MAMLPRVAALMTVAAASCSPFGGGAFHCDTDDQCAQTGIAGTCETNGFCAFPDPACTPPRRYGDLSGPLSGQCISTGSPIDGKPDAKEFLDAAIDAPPGQVCYGHVPGISVCFTTPPTGSITLPATIDTRAGSPDCTAMPINSAMTSDWCVIAADSITVGTVAVSGARPLVLLAVSSMTVGTLDAASHRLGVATNAGQIGPGSIPSNDNQQCNPGSAAAVSGGGAGGSFGSQGGDGGNTTGGNAGNTIGAGSLRGGCYGRDGASGMPGRHGLGGGAVYLFAGANLQITGSINASGAAGTGGGPTNGGGGGGGSGGLIVLDAPSITNSGQVFANGGGGGEGASTTGGNPGREPNGVNAAGTASGGSTGGAGGNGAAAGTPAANGATAAAAGGGGGGGGVGVILVFGGGTLLGAVSPNPQ